MNTQDILDLPMESDIGETTIRGFLTALLQELWTEGEGFSGKRPFGNGDWQFQIYLPLVKAGLVKGEIDDDGYLDNVDYKLANKIVLNLIWDMCTRP